MVRYVWCETLNQKYLRSAWSPNSLTIMRRELLKHRQWGQVKTIQAMAALLEDNEHEGYYRRSRRRNENFHDRSGNTNNNNTNFRNYRGNFNNYNQNNVNQNNENNYRPSNQNNNNNSAGNYNNNNNTRRPQNYNNHPNRPKNQGGNNQPQQYRRANYVQANYEQGRRRYYPRRNSFSGDRRNARGGRWRSRSIEGDSRNNDYQPQVNFVQARNQSNPGRPDTRSQTNVTSNNNDEDWVSVCERPGFTIWHNQAGSARESRSGSGNQDQDDPSMRVRRAYNQQNPPESWIHLRGEAADPAHPNTWDYSNQNVPNTKRDVKAMKKYWHHHKNIQNYVKLIKEYKTVLCIRRFIIRCRIS